jgi:hypothetical protein
LVVAKDTEMEPILNFSSEIEIKYPLSNFSILKRNFLFLSLEVIST